MKKFFIALEEQSEEFLSEEIAPELVVEKDSEAVDDSNGEISDVLEISEDINTDIVDTERAEDVSDALESLCEIISHMESYTPVNIALIKLTANMAVAGTNVPANALFSANEDFTDLSVTIEGIQDKIKAVGATVAKSVSEISNKIVNFIKRVFIVYERYTQRIAQLREKLNQVKSTTKVKSVSVEISGRSGLRVDADYVTDANQYLTAFKQTSKFIGNFNEIFTTQYSRMFSDGITLLKNIPKKEEEATSKFLEVFNTYDKEFFGKLIKSPGFKKITDPAELNDGSADDYDHYELSGVLGDIKFIIETPVNNGFDKTNMKEIKDNITHYYLGSSRTVSFLSMKKYVKETISFNDVNLAYVSSLLTECEKVVQVTKQYLNRQFKLSEQYGKIDIGKYLLFGNVAGSAGGASLKSGALLAGGAVGAVGGLVLGNYLIYKSVNLRLQSNMVSNLNRVANTTWRNVDQMVATSLGICDKILSSKDWSGQATS